MSAICGAAELLDEDMPREQRQRFLANIRAETARIQGLVDRLLQLAAVEKRKALRDVELMDVTALVSDVTESFGPVLADRDLSVELEPASPIGAEASERVATARPFRSDRERKVGTFQGSGHGRPSVRLGIAPTSADSIHERGHDSLGTKQTHVRSRNP